MAVELNHTIVHARDNRESAEFLAGILGLDVGPQWGPFIPVATANGVTLDFASYPAGSITRQHYAFLISDEEFDAAFARIEAAGVTYYADPYMSQAGEINRHHGGRGLYFADPVGHYMEIMTRPYDAHTR
ncbi:VOC family protein [Actinacidiphila bryophytorum]|uniref:VOC family protein n=1 Tax=Actinacidiphila bryophytorum TaxID=1436133 RepID=A0A9W4H2D1_9ACTN|nr:VOC family protein [Actinacidiphila bryophytorum]MBM9440591.1 VOC family protein [Actinacidiphila bryophytorum]MBN6543174.1 VOC family protein [Actinacidiphila bryophytorum]CAG7645246.1 VOC family protein [Actinacidiphila bryophytorum]